MIQQTLRQRSSPILGEDVGGSLRRRRMVCAEVSALPHVKMHSNHIESRFVLTSEKTWGFLGLLQGRDYELIRFKESAAPPGLKTHCIGGRFFFDTSRIRSCACEHPSWPCSFFCKESAAFSNRLEFLCSSIPSSFVFQVQGSFTWRLVSLSRPSPSIGNFASVLSSISSFFLSRGFLRAATFPVMFTARCEARYSAQQRKRNKKAYSSALSPTCIASCGASSDERAVRSLVLPFVLCTENKRP